MTVDPVIETQDLAKRYGSTVALAGLSMSVGRGEVYGFLGPNGAGKTTAVKLLLGLARPSSGTGRLLGAPLGDRATRRRVGYLPELFRYQAWLRAREVLALHCELAGLPRAGWPAEIDGALSLVGLAPRGDHLVGTYSKGMQQRLGLGIALLGAPQLVILDEPTSALDPIGRVDVRSIIHALRDRGTTVFLNSHLLTEVERVCDRVAIVDQGRVIADGPIGTITAAGMVRLHVTELPDDAHASLERFGTITRARDELMVGSIDRQAIPDLVAAVVAAGGRVHAVEPVRTSLEERFLELLGGGRE